MFVYSLPLLFEEIGVLKPLELLLALLMAAGFLWAAAPQPVGMAGCTEGHGGLRRFLISAWQGTAPLWQVFWPFFLLLNGALYGIDTLAKTGEFTVSSWDEVHFILFTPVLFWSLCVWRNSANCNRRLWAAAAWLAVLAVYGEYALKLFIRLNYARDFFNCHEFLFDYASCF